MRDELRANLTQRLVADYGFKERPQWLQQGRCPACGHKELYAPAEAPWLLKCGRENNCGAEFHVKELYPDLFDHWSRRYPVTAASPHAAADAYLREARGFDLARIKGTYTQESYADHAQRISTATVRFALGNGNWWERLIDRPERFGKMKARFAPGRALNGQWWQATYSPPAPGQLWLVEGIFDAIALELNDIPARAILSCNQYPKAALKRLAEFCAAHECRRPVLVWALDHDPAGQRYTRKWAKQARAEGWKCQAAQIPPPPRGKLDWNDLHQRGKLGEKDIRTYLHHGALLLARSPYDKAALLFNHKRRWQFHFEYDKRLYWFKLDRNKIPARGEDESEDLLQMVGELTHEKIIKHDAVKEIANCVPSILYYQANLATDEAWYYFKIDSPHFPQPLKATFTARQRTVAAEFKTRLMHVVPGALWTGTQKQLDHMMREAEQVMRVDTIDHIGYSREYGCYVFEDFAMRKGVLAKRNQDDYFEFGRLAIKSLSQSVSLSLNQDMEAYRKDWLDLIWQCFGAKGLVALTFWFGSLFAEQIRAHDKSWPFLEIVGEAGSGKSTLVEFLWKLVGRANYEGFDPTKSTAAARARNFAQVANLPVVLIESEREVVLAKQKSFDWEELKTAYNGRSVRSRGMKNNGNETYEPPFRASIVIAQNAPVEGSDAIVQRIVHLGFDKSSHSVATKPLAEQLERMPLEAVSGFLIRAIAAETAVMEAVVTRREGYEKRIMDRGDVPSVRIAKNHAQLMALADALVPVAGLSQAQLAAVQHLLEEMAAERQKEINLDHPHVEVFWEQFEYLDGRALKNGELVELDHSPHAGTLAFSLVEYEAACTKEGIRPPCEMGELKRLLKTSRRRPFVGMKAVRSSRVNRVLHCWLFQNRA